jgi:hypothetical protein
MDRRCVSSQVQVVVLSCRVEQSLVADAMEPRTCSRKRLMNSFGMSVIVRSRARPLRRNPCSGTSHCARRG